MNIERAISDHILSTLENEQGQYTYYLEMREHMGNLQWIAAGKEFEAMLNGVGDFWYKERPQTLIPYRAPFFINRYEQLQKAKRGE